MNVYVINRLGKKIFVRALLKDSEAPGVVNDLILELHGGPRRKQKTR